MFLFDIDNFKNYNDTNGHLAGDKLLQELAGLVNDAVRKDDIFGRFGGEEFLLVLPHTNATQGMAAAEKIRSLLANHPFPFAEKQPLGLHQHQRRRGRVPAPRARRRGAAPRVGRGAVRGQAQREKPRAPGEGGRAGAERGPRRGQGAAATVTSPPAPAKGPPARAPPFPTGSGSRTCAGCSPSRAAWGSC